MKNKLIFLILLLPIFFGCESSTKPPSDLPFTLSAEKVSCTDAWLKISLNNVTLPKLLFMRASDSDGYNVHHITTKDTIFHFTGLIPGKDYTYWYYVGDSPYLSKDDMKNSSNILTIRTLDTTSYNFTWKENSIGGWLSCVNGIWGSSSNDVWAVGRFNYESSPASYIAHYDGSGWTNMYLPLFQDPVRGLHAGNLNGIYGISPDKMWVVGNGRDTNPLTKEDTNRAYAAFWNNNEWQDISPKSLEVRLLGVWAYDENNVWAIGSSGKILYYDGRTWTEQFSITGCDLCDINGTSPENLYVVGADYYNNSSGILLKFNGTTWQRVPTSIYDSKNPFYSVWVESDKSVWVAGRYLMIHHDIVSAGDDWDVQWTNDELHKIRGLAGNDIFTGGYYGAIGQFNGKTLSSIRYLFQDQQDFYAHDILVFKDKVFFAGSGGKYGNGVIIMGMR